MTIKPLPSGHEPLPALARWRAVFHSALIRPVSTGEDARRKEYILNVILVTSIAALIAFDGLALYHALIGQPSYMGIPFPMFSVFPALFTAILALSRRGHYMVASYFLITTLFLGNVYASLNWGVDLPTALLAYAFIICTASILLGSTAGFVATTLIAAIASGIWTVHINGLLSHEPQYPSADDIATFGMFYFLIMTVSWLSNRDMEKSLVRARASEQALTKERDLLEMRVAERTEELRRAQFEEIAQVHRFAEFGQLSSGLFHDLLNLLAALSLRTEGYMEDDPSLAAAYETTRQIRQFMRAVQEQLGRDNSCEEFSLREGIAQAVRLVSYKANKENVDIFIEGQDRDPFLYEGIPFKFHQIVINLLTNAIDAYRAIPYDGTRRREVIVRAETRGKNFVISVKDFGCGIPDDSREKIFTPFFTTKDKTEGIGIGLATVKKTVEEDFRGAVNVGGAEGEGSVFTVSFPMRSRQSECRPK